MQRRYSVVPQCSICVENLGKYGGPATLACGHNFCLQCIASASQKNASPECPLCRAPFPPEQPLFVNTELRDLVKFATTLHTVDCDGWETITATKGADGSEEDVKLVPSAPPLRVSLSTVLEGGGDLLSLEPPKWIPDSHAAACGICNRDFKPVRRSRHHCRLCGGIFCQACSDQQLLLPPKFQQTEPQRACKPCAELLQPLQPFLAGTISKAVQPAIHDVTDSSAMRSWFNSPLSTTLEADIYKATNIVRAFARVGNNPPERHIPSHILKNAAGFAILSAAKVGLGWSGVIGTGLVVGQTDGVWTSPSAISMAGVGWGFQVGGTVSDILIVLRNRQALQAFCGRVHVGGGLGASVAVGPIGRQAEAALRLGVQGGALCYSYSMSAGIFAGISIEGSVVSTRDHINLSFYGRPVTARQLLLEGKFASPVSAASLYSALDDLLVRVGAPLKRGSSGKALQKGSPTASAPPLGPLPGAQEDAVRGSALSTGSLHAYEIDGARLAPESDTEEDVLPTGLFSD